MGTGAQEARWNIAVVNAGGVKREAFDFKRRFRTSSRASTSTGRRLPTSGSPRVCISTPAQRLMGPMKCTPSWRRSIRRS